MAANDESNETYEANAIFEVEIFRCGEWQSTLILFYL